MLGMEETAILADLKPISTDSAEDSIHTAPWDAFADTMKMGATAAIKTPSPREDIRYHRTCDHGRINALF